MNSHEETLQYLFEYLDLNHLNNKVTIKNSLPENKNNNYMTLNNVFFENEFNTITFKNISGIIVICPDDIENIVHTEDDEIIIFLS